MLTLKELIDNQINNRKIWLEKISTTENGYYNYSGNFQTFHFQLAIYELTEGKTFSVKSNLYVCGLIDEFRVEKFNNRFLDYGLNNICLVLLSDNEELIQRYSKLRYQKG